MDVKVCGRCTQEKPIGEFSWKDEVSGKRHSVCKACHKEYRQQHYLENQDKYQDKARRWRSENIAERRLQARTYIIEYLRSHPCLDCGESDIVVLDFDHVRGTKRENVSNLAKSGTPLRGIIAEIAKCEVRCSNCHRRKTAKERGHWYRLMEDY